MKDVVNPHTSAGGGSHSAAPTVSVRLEKATDRAAIYEVHRLAFGRTDEAVLVNALRDGGWIELALVAEIRGGIIGHVAFSRMAIGEAGGHTPALALAPVAVLRSYQRQGVGAQLIREGLERLARVHHRIVLVLGEPSYYQRFGFLSELTRTIRSPFPGENLMGLELAAGALRNVRGRTLYPSPFGLDAEWTLPASP